MADNIIPVDFGKEYSEAAATFAKLVGWADTYAAKVRADPVEFVRQAHAEVAALQREMRRAREALYIRRDLAPAQGVPSSIAEIETVRMHRDDYDALKRLEAVVRGWDKSR